MKSSTKATNSISKTCNINTVCRPNLDGILHNRSKNEFIQPARVWNIAWYFLNQARAWFPEIVLRKVCVYVCMHVCMYVCMYICLSFRTHVSKPFTWSLKAACTQTIKAKQSLYYTHAQISSASKVCFFPNRKPGVATVHRLQSQLSYSTLQAFYNRKAAY